MHEYVRIKNIKEGDILGKAVYDEKCRVLLRDGNKITNRSLETLKELGYKGLYIENDTSKRREDIPIAEPLLEDITILQMIGLLNDLFNNRNPENNVFDPIFTITRKKLEDLVEEMVDRFYQLEEEGKLVYETEDNRNNKNWLLYHSLNTAIITCGTAIKMGLPKADVIFMTLGALYHDYGKALLNVVLINNTNLTNRDREEIRTHAEKAFRVFQRLNYPIETTYSIWFHHEHCDGTGYPKAVKGDKIPVGAKIVGLASYFDNQVNYTPYNKNPLNYNDAIEQLSADSKFDNECKRAMMQFVCAYPVGSKVELSNGMQGLVIKNIPAFILRPYVLVGKELYDLAKDDKCLNITITRLIEQ